MLSQCLYTYIGDPPVSSPGLHSLSVDSTSSAYSSEREDSVEDRAPDIIFREYMLWVRKRLAHRDARVRACGSSLNILSYYIGLFNEFVNNLAHSLANSSQPDAISRKNRGYSAQYPPYVVGRRSRATRHSTASAAPRKNKPPFHMREMPSWMVDFENNKPKIECENRLSTFIKPDIHD